MGNIPTTENTAASDISIFIGVINEAVEKAAQTAIQTAVPALALPVIDQIIDAIEDAVANTITKYEQLGATFVVTDIQVALEKERVSSDVAAILADQKSGNNAQLAKDEAQFQEDTSSLAHDDGSSTPAGMP